MPKTQKKALQKFLLNLMDKPQALKQLKSNPHRFISKSALSKTHKQILLGNDPKKIKNIVADAVASPEFGFHIVFGTSQQQVKVSLGMKPKAFKESSKAPLGFAINMVFNTGPGGDDITGKAKD